MPAYYNEIDPYAAQWLRNLIAAGHIAPGDVDERSIEDVHPNDLKPYTQCHFFAGVGVWSYALRRAGWPDDRPVWTGSCPCQPFSAAGQGDGFDDKRHLWPHFNWLIGERQPSVIFGEQVASKDAEPWLDLVQADVEAMEYAFGAVAFPSAGVGAPHIRDRTYWVAYANSRAGRQGRSYVRGRVARGDEKPRTRLGSSGLLVGMDHADHPRLEGYPGYGGAEGRQGSQRPVTSPSIPVRLADADGQHQRPARDSTRAGNTGGLIKTVGVADLHGDRCDQRRPSESSAGNDGAERDRSACGLANPTGDRRQQGGRHLASCAEAHSQRTTNQHRDGSPVNGLWRDADWLFCRDGKWRPVEPGTFPLAHGAPSRVGRLRAYGNAINAEAATQFIGAYMEIT